MGDDDVTRQGDKIHCETGNGRQVEGIERWPQVELRNGVGMTKNVTWIWKYWKRTRIEFVELIEQKQSENGRDSQQG
jgi:hypothetical protein